MKPTAKRWEHVHLAEGCPEDRLLQRESSPHLGDAPVLPKLLFRQRLSNRR